MSRTGRSPSSKLAMGICLGLAGLALFGCAATEAQTNAAPSATSATTNVEPSSPASEGAQTTLSSSSSTKQASDDRFGLSTGMLYRDARTQLMRQGWQPHTRGDAPNLSNSPVRALFNLGYTEVKDCAGTGMGLCRFEFTNDAGELLVVSAAPEGSDERDRTVWRWFIEETNTTSENSLPFVGRRSFNFLGGSGTGQSITITDDGTTTVQLHGTAGTSVEYQGPFSNPIILSDGSGLVLAADKIYSLTNSGQVAQGCRGEGTLCEAELYEPESGSSSASRFVEGFYALGGTDQGLEISGDQYRYYDEMGTQEWQPVSNLTYIRDGLVFDGRLYWCIPTERAPGVCTENGWNSSQ
ncbi:MAG TPA: hypothetical protein V6C88_20945 [Chroococcidiopsis sp.]